MEHHNQKLKYNVTHLPLMYLFMITIIYQNTYGFVDPLVWFLFCDLFFVISKEKIHSQVFLYTNQIYIDINNNIAE